MRQSPIRESSSAGRPIWGAVLLAALMLPASSEALAGEPGPPPRITLHDVTDLSGPWRAVAEDDPAYAAPDLAAGDWFTVALPQARSDPRLEAERFAWFRKDLVFDPPAPDDPGVGFLLGHVYGGFEVYADGRRVGGAGRLGPDGKIGPLGMRVFELPRDLLADGRLALAIRIWKPSWGNRQAQPRIPARAPPSMGPLRAMHGQAHAARMDFSARRVAPLAAVTILLLLVGSYHFYLFSRRRELENYFLYGTAVTLYALGNVPRLFYWSGSELLGGIEVALRVPYACIALFFVITTEFLYRFLLGRSPGRLVRGLQAWLVLASAVDLVLGSAVWSWFSQTAWMITVYAPAQLLLLGIVWQAFRAHDRNAPTVGVGLILTAGLAAINALANMSLLPPQFFLAESLILVPFLLAMAVALARHFTDTLDELDESERGLERKVEERTAELEDINQVARTVNSTLDLDRVIETINLGLRKVFSFDQMGVFLLDPARERLLLDRQAGKAFAPEMWERLRSSGIPLSEKSSAMVTAVRERRNVYAARIDAETVASLSPTDRFVYESSPMHSLLLCPLEIRGAMIGCIFFANTREPFDLSESDIETIQRYVTTLGTAIQNARLFTEAEIARGAAEEANRTKSAFLANMSHELRTPLNAIIGYSEMLQDEARDEGHQAYLPDLGKILASGRYLLELINGVLDLAKIESGKMDVFLEDFDVAELVQGVGGTIQPLVRKNANRLELCGVERLGSMHSDVTKLRQMLLNLLSNASKFTQQGTIRLETERRPVDGADWLTFRVIDSGIGMNAEQVSRVFEEFSQAETATTKEYGGTGLGLPITKRFCEMLGGRVRVSSEPGRGSCFELILPARVPTPT